MVRLPFYGTWSACCRLRFLMYGLDVSIVAVEIQFCKLRDDLWVADCSSFHLGLKKWSRSLGKSRILDFPMLKMVDDGQGFCCKFLFGYTTSLFQSWKISAVGWVLLLLFFFMFFLWIRFFGLLRVQSLRLFFRLYFCRFICCKAGEASQGWSLLHKRGNRQPDDSSLQPWMPHTYSVIIYSNAWHLAVSLLESSLTCPLCFQGKSVCIYISQSPTPFVDGFCTECSSFSFSKASISRS